MDRLESILGKAIYDGIRNKCRGFITVKIQDDKCFIAIKYDELYYAETFEELSRMILEGQFVSAIIVNGFVRRWRTFAVNEFEKKMFYKERP